MSDKPSSPGSRVHNALLGWMRRLSPRMSVLENCAAVVAFVLACAVLFTLHGVVEAQERVTRANENFQACQLAASEMQESSDQLTSEARNFVTRQDRINLGNYLAVLNGRNASGGPMDTLRTYALNSGAITALENALEQSERLAQTELYAMRLVATAINMTDLPDELSSIELTPADQQSTTQEKRTKAYSLVYDETYRNQKLSIRAAVQACTERLSDTLREQIEEGSAVLESQLLWMRVGVVILVLVLVFVILSSRLLLLWPISLYEKNIQKDEPLEPGGARELRTLSFAYNEMYARNHALTESLAFEAHCDALTGVNNRGSFDALVTLHKTDCALILVDVDYFKQFNDKWGHDMGDAILVEVAATLYSCFRSTDYICRIGGDEFAVIMADAQPSMRDVIAHKIEKVSRFLRDDSNGLPGATISVGVAFGGPGSTDDGLFQQADAALYATKRAGRDGITFASDLDEQAE